MTGPSPAEPGLSADALLGGRLHFFQPRHGYRVAIDPVLLAAAVRIGDAPEEVLDAGAGTGAAALCLAARTQAARVTGLERQSELLGLARRNAAANDLDGRVRFLEGDLLAPPPALKAACFEQVMTNPPFHPAGRSSAPPEATRRGAHLAEVGVDAWLHACLARLRPKGRLTLIHRADQLDVILAALAGRTGDITVCPLWPDATAPAAKRVIVAARKGSRSPCRLGRGLVLHGPDGRFTPEAEAILRHGAPLPL
jgi:tRNA1(Val) A37 N6-methylase TrmN6